MKKSVCLCLLLSMLLMCGCDKSAKTKDLSEQLQTMISTSETTVSEIEGEKIENDTTASESEADDEKFLFERANYDIVVEDRSYRNDSGLVLIEHSYELVHITDICYQADQINYLLEREMESFFLSESELEENASSPFVTPENPFFYTAKAQVTHNENGILSIIVKTDWMMGGVHNTDYIGSVFDLQNGHRTNLGDLTDIESDALETMLKDNAWEYLFEKYGEELWPYAEETVYSYALDEFNYYIENSEIILLFDTYELSFGAAGPFKVPTGIYLSDN